MALWQRYGRRFLQAWRGRHQQPAGLFNEDEAEFLPAALSLQEAPIPPACAGRPACWWRWWCWHWRGH
jgi:hemolysin D